MASDGRPSQSIAARISTRLVQILSEYTGRGPTKARTNVNTNFILVVMEDTLTKGERSLVAAGQPESVLQHRKAFQQVIRSDAVAAVEEATGRKVRAFLTDIAPEDDVGVLVFLLEPLPETGTVAVADSPA
jgi:uncharacterized protein YbcI